MRKTKLNSEALAPAAGLIDGAIRAAAPTLTEGHMSAAVLQERMRIGHILEAPEAQGRQRLALELALRTNVDHETATALLMASPQEDSFGAALLANATNLGPAAGGGLDPVLQFDKRSARLAEIKNLKDRR